MMFILWAIFVVNVGADLNDTYGQCRLDPHPSVEYRCIVPGGEGTRACGAYEPAGTQVDPRCQRPNFYYTSPLSLMHCLNGYWDYIARCAPECGRVSPAGSELVIGGKPVMRGEFPWHAGIYSTTSDPYMQICGGSLISNSIVLSAAHCFWDRFLGKLKPASGFAVAVGKLYRPWNDKTDGAQKSRVKVIHIPSRFQGSSTNYQDDIAIVIVARDFQFKTYIRPVCINFDFQFEQQQLYSGNNGKVAGWGLMAADGNPSSVLHTVDLPYVEISTCINKSPLAYREYITSDKICAGTLEPNTAVCKGDSGGGLAFSGLNQGIERYYLRGIVSTAPTNDHACNTVTYTSFTSIAKHDRFIKQFWIESGEFKCQDGGFITATNQCDGVKHCADGSDETMQVCRWKLCSSYLFRCKYGACIDTEATCNQVADCADGSDEADELCGARPNLTAGTNVTNHNLCTDDSCECSELLDLINKKDRTPQELELLRNSRCGFQETTPKTTLSVTTLGPGTPSKTQTRVKNTLTEKIGNFSIELLYHTFELHTLGQNTIISPTTIWTALAVILEGAIENTKNQISDALRLPKNRNAIQMSRVEIAQLFQVKTNIVELAKFNGIFVDKLRLPLTDFQTTAKTSYNVDVVVLNFENSELAANLFNGVISNFTHGRLESIVKGSDFQNTPMVLASAIYFKGQWTVPFKTTSTSKKPFYDIYGKQIGEVNMMYNCDTLPFSNIKMLQAWVIELPYGKESRLSMLIMLPNLGVSFENILFNFQNVSLNSLFEDLRQSKENSNDKVDCFIPRFKIKAELDMTDILRKRFGIEDLFDMSKARLPYMARTPLYASKLIHKAEIEVTEDGTVSSAATTDNFCDRIDVVQFEANRPFVYMVVEKITNTIVLEGVYSQPSLY